MGLRRFPDFEVGFGLKRRNRDENSRGVVFIPSR